MCVYISLHLTAVRWTNVEHAVFVVSGDCVDVDGEVRHAFQHHLRVALNEGALCGHVT